MKTIRVLHCPLMVGGNAYQLACAERELGLRSWSITFERTYLNYSGDELIVSEGTGRVVKEMKRWWWLLRAIRNFDVIHFNFGQSLMPKWNGMPMAKPGGDFPLVEKILWRLYGGYARLFELCDLPILKRAGKGMVVTYQGDDARQGDFCLNHFEFTTAKEVEKGYYTPESDSRKRKRIALFSRYADRIYALNPDLLHVLPPQAQFLPYAHIDLRDWKPVQSKKSDSGIPIVLHAPSHRGVKGTRFITEAISQLKREGVPLEFVLVEKTPHTEARRLYERADLLIDQLLAGWYGGLAVEFMALGKPVISYIRETDLKFIPEQMRQDLPILNATPQTLYTVLKKYLSLSSDERSEVGRRGRAYVEKWHDPLKIAARLKTEYESMMASKLERERCSCAGS